ANCLPQREKTHRNALVFFRLRHSLLEPASQINCHALIQKSWAHVKEKRLLPARSPVPGFFNQFTLGGGKVVLARINASGGQLPQALACCISILALQQDQRRASRIVERQ